MDIFTKNWNISTEDIQQRIELIVNQELKLIDEQKAYRDILGLIDLTTLEGSDNDAKINQLCLRAQSYKNDEKQIPGVAAVCVYPPFVNLAKSLLKKTEINVASVAGAFPSGQSPMEVKLAEIAYAVSQGADEIDMVISRGAFLEGNFQRVFDEIRTIKNVCGKAHLKVILETGELQSPENIRRASDISIYAGADFIKTSTGKIQPAATEEAFLVMLDAIKDYYRETGLKIGIKPAGGISEPETALRYYALIKNVLGEEWINSHLFRFGASRLANKVFEKINA